MPYGFESDIFFGGAIQKKRAPLGCSFLLAIGIRTGSVVNDLPVAGQSRGDLTSSRRENSNPYCFFEIMDLNGLGSVNTALDLYRELPQTQKEKLKAELSQNPPDSLSSLCHKVMDFQPKYVTEDYYFPLTVSVYEYNEY